MKYTENYIQSLDRIQLDNIDRDELQNKVITITGAGGLICSCVVDVLIWMNRKYSLNMKIYTAGRDKIKLVRRFSKWNVDKDYYFLKYDAVVPLENYVEADYIIHGASNANPHEYSLQPVETMLANISGVQNQLEFLRKERHGRFLYISSSEVYGQKKTNEPYSEDDYGCVDILNPRACYPSSKRAAETLCAAYKREYDVDFITVRPGHIYGPTMKNSDNRASSQFFRDASQGKDIVMKSTGTQLRSYCYVIDCVTAIIKVLLKGNSGEAYNISNSKSIVTIRELAEHISQLAGVKLVFENATDGEKASYNLMENSSLRSDKLENLGWTGRFGLDDGVRATLESI